MDEEVAIIEFLASGTIEVAPEDDLHRRVVDVFSDPEASDLDRGVIFVTSCEGGHCETAEMFP